MMMAAIESATLIIEMYCITESIDSYPLPLFFLLPAVLMESTFASRPVYERHGW